MPTAFTDIRDSESWIRDSCPTAGMEPGERAVPSFLEEAGVHLVAGGAGQDLQVVVRQRLIELVDQAQRDLPRPDDTALTEPEGLGGHRVVTGDAHFELVADDDAVLDRILGRVVPVFDPHEFASGHDVVLEREVLVRPGRPHPR